MPTVPSFGAYAPKPNLAESYLGGARVAIARDQLAQEAQQASMRMAMEHERLSQQRAIAEAELEAKTAAETQERLRRQQELQIEKSYKDAQINLEERKLNQYQRKLQQDLQESTRKIAAQQQYQQEMAAPDADPLKVLMRLGPSVGASIPAAAFPKPKDTYLSTPREVMAPSGRLFYQTEEGGEPKPYAPGYDLEGREGVTIRGEQRESIEKEIARLKKLNEGIEAVGLNKAPDAQDKPMVQAYRERLQRIAELEAMLSGARQPATRAQIPPGVSPSSSTNAALKILSIRRK